MFHFHEVEAYRSSQERSQCNERRELTRSSSLDSIINLIWFCCWVNICIQLRFTKRLKAKWNKARATQKLHFCNLQPVWLTELNHYDRVVFDWIFALTRKRVMLLSNFFFAISKCWKQDWILHTKYTYLFNSSIQAQWRRMELKKYFFLSIFKASFESSLSSSIVKQRQRFPWFLFLLFSSSSSSTSPSPFSLHYSLSFHSETWNLKASNDAPHWAAHIQAIPTWHFVILYKMC